MGLFGWSLPPGCGMLPGEETGAVSLTHLLEDVLDKGMGAWLTEDGVIGVHMYGNDIDLGFCHMADNETEEQYLERAAQLIRLRIGPLTVEAVRVTKSED